MRLGCRRATVGGISLVERRGGDYGTDHVFGFFREKGNCAGAIALDVLLDESHFIEKKRFSQKVY